VGKSSARKPSEFRRPGVQCIIVTWNQGDEVLRLLESLQDIDYPTDCLSILVVDNASTDGTGERIEAAYPDVVLVTTAENLGGSGGFTVGMKWALEHSNHEYLWLLDSDVIVHQSALEELVVVLESDEAYGVCGSTMLQLEYPSIINEIGGFVRPESGALQLHRHKWQLSHLRGASIDDLRSRDLKIGRELELSEDAVDVDYVAAASLLVRKKIVEQVGLWCDYFLHFDDVEWCLRIREAGHRISASVKSIIWHVSAKSKLPTWVLYYDTRNVLDLLRRHFPGYYGAVLRRSAMRGFYYHLFGRPACGDLILYGAEAANQELLGKASNLDAPPILPLSDFVRTVSELGYERCVVNASIEEHIQSILRPKLVELQRMGVNVCSYDGTRTALAWLPNQRIQKLPRIRIVRFLWWLLGRSPVGSGSIVVQSPGRPCGLSALWADRVITIAKGGFIVERPSWRKLAHDLVRACALIFRSLKLSLTDPFLR